MYKIKVVGAGSIGNHLTNACRNKGWEVCVVDTDSVALDRMKTDIYPSRYGNWDEGIRLSLPEDVSGEVFDAIFVGTPPDSHLPICLNELKNNAPKVLMVEKPLCKPDLAGCDELVALAAEKGTKVCVGYNHTLNTHTKEMEKWIRERKAGDVITMDANVREYWGGIFAAHPWLAGPSDSYLGFWERGGGACAEHSHGINNWQHFAHVSGKGRVVEVSANLQYTKDGDADYDSICQIDLTTESGFIGRVVQDVVTQPVDKSVSLYCEQGIMKWIVNIDKDNDALVWSPGDGETEIVRFPKTRPDDFKGEVDALEQLLNGDIEDVSISANYGMDTMMVVAAAHLSSRERKTVKIDYSKGFNPGAFTLA